MFAKIKNNQVVQWPIPSLAPLFPNTSFPASISNADLPDGYVMVDIIAPPQHGSNQKVVPGQPIQQGGKWVQSWNIIEMTPEELAERLAVQQQDNESYRKQAYQDEADPLFFKWQRGEATEQEWLDKIAN